MNEKLDLIKILKDCPEGMELDCTIYDNVVFSKIDFDENNDYPIKIKTNNGHVMNLTKYGTYINVPEAKCLIFPKGKNTWEGFQRPFKDGDIIVSTFGNIAIFSHTKKNSTGQNVVYYHCLYSNEPIYKFKACIDCGIGYVEDCRLATEHEKKLMMEAIRKYGYKWNKETKTLEKLVVPKFKVGDTIRTKNGLQTYEVTNITSEYYSVQIPGCVGLLPVKDQDDYILIPNKFDPKTLKPFDKVLVRYNSESNWCIAFFSHIDNDLKMFCHKFVTAGYMSFRQMIPYNEETKHLLGTNEQAPEFYRY